jgi:hypothetical protein
MDWRASSDAGAKGPNMCNGKKIPELPYGKWVCKRNLDEDGDKKGTLESQFAALTPHF